MGHVLLMQGLELGELCGPCQPSRSMLVGVCYSSRSLSQLVSNRDNVAPQDGFEGRFELPVFPCRLQAPGPAVGSVPSRVSAAASAPVLLKALLGHRASPGTAGTPRVWSWHRTPRRDL